MFIFEKNNDGMTAEIQSMVFSESMKVADLVDVNFKLLNVLSRLDISLGFGENTIREMCRKHGIDLNSFLLICSMYTYDNYIPSADLLAGADPGKKSIANQAVLLPKFSAVTGSERFYNFPLLRP